MSEVKSRIEWWYILIIEDEQVKDETVNDGEPFDTESLALNYIKTADEIDSELEYLVVKAEKVVTRSLNINTLGV